MLACFCTCSTYHHWLGLTTSAEYYCGAKAGRFIQPDPIGFKGGDTNLYAYVLDNPSTYSDPSGKIVPIFTPIVIGAGIGGASGFIGSVLMQYLMNNRVNWKDAGQSALSGALTGAAMPFLGTKITGAVLLGAIGNALQYYMATDVNNLNRFDWALSAFFGGLGGTVGGAFIMPEATIFAATPWWVIASNNATVVGTARNIAGAGMATIPPSSSQCK